MAKYDEKDGVWRTIGGRRVFIRDGQSLASAMKESGKFSRVERNKDLYKKLDEEKAKDNYKEETSSKKNYEKKEGNSLETISKEEYDKLPKDYKGTLKELINTAEFRGENKEELEKFYKDKGFDIENDKTIVKMTEKGATLIPVKVEDDKKREEVYKVQDDLSIDKGFSQNIDYDGSSRLYNKNELERMKNNGIKPMQNSYTGGGWEGTKYDSKLSTKEIAKNITDYSKKEFPDVKLARKTDYNGIDIHIMSSDKDLYANANDIDKMDSDEVFKTIHESIGGVSRLDDWLNKNNRKNELGSYSTQDAKDYLKSELETYRNRKGYNATGNEWYLSDYGKKVVSGLNKEMNSYNYDDSDGMVDYFDTNFYGYVKIGKWDKPYEAKGNSNYRNEYKEYMNEHPNSNMTLSEFEKMKKK